MPRRLTLFKRVALVGGALMIIAQACAQEGEDEPLVTDRPDFTESTDTLAKGRMQLEGGYTYTRTGADKSNDLGELLLRIGTSDRSEVRIGFNSYTRTRGPGGNASGFQDTSVGMKFRLAKGSETFNLARPNVSLLAHTTLPTGSRAFREKKLQPEAKLLFGWDINDKWSMASNLNYAWPSEGGERFGQFSGSLSLGLSWNERLGSFFEYFGFVPGSESGPNANYVNTGVTYLLDNDNQLDFRVGMGLNGDNNDYFIGAGAARRW